MTEQIIRDYKLKITAAWQKQVPSIIETGQYLIEAKEALGHGEWGKLFEGDNKLSFSINTAQKLMKIARHPSAVKSGVYSVFAGFMVLPLCPDSVAATASGTSHCRWHHYRRDHPEEAIALVRQSPRTTGDPRPLSPADDEFQRDLDLLLKVAEINAWLTLEPPWENDGFRAGLKRHLLERRFLPAESISEEIESAISFLSETLQMVRQIKAEVATETVVTQPVAGGCVMSVKPWTRRCAVCNQPFEVDRPKTVTCGPACSREKRRQRDRERYVAIHHKEKMAAKAAAKS